MKIPLRLNEEGYHTRNGASWGFSAVNRILTHPGYKGRHQLGLKMPVIIDESVWGRAQQKREKARSVRNNVKGWLLQGMCICGSCGHILSCIQKRPTETQFYVCRGRFRHSHLDGGLKCPAPWVKAQWLEWAVWNKVKTILNDPEMLLHCVEDALTELEDKRAQIGGETLAIDHELEGVRAKQQRLGITFTDGTVTEELYRSKLQQLKKQELLLLKCRQNIDPPTLMELNALDDRIATVRESLDRGKLMLTEFGIFGMVGDQMVPAGFNAWRETDGRLAIGGVTKQDTFLVEGTHLVLKGIDAPAGFWQCKDPREQDERIKRNLRAILQLFNVKVYVFPDRVEIQGTISMQMLDIPAQALSKHAPITCSGY